MELLVDVEALGVPYLSGDALDLREHGFELGEPVLLGLVELLGQLIVLLLFDEELQRLDEFVDALRALLQTRDVPVEGRSLCHPPVPHQLTFLYHLRQIRLHLLQLRQVLVLHLAVLHLNNSQIFFVLFGHFAEPLGMIARLLVHQFLGVLGLMFCSVKEFIELVLERLVLNPRQILLILQPLPGLAHEVLVVEEITGQLVIDRLSLFETAF